MRQYSIAITYICLTNTTRYILYIKSVTNNIFPSRHNQPSIRYILILYLVDFMNNHKVLFQMVVLHLIMPVFDITYSYLSRKDFMRPPVTRIADLAIIFKKMIE